MGRTEMWIVIYVCDYIAHENQILGIMQKGAVIYSLSKYGLYFYSCSFRMRGITLF